MDKNNKIIGYGIIGVSLLLYVISLFNAIVYLVDIDYDGNIHLDTNCFAMLFASVLATPFSFLFLLGGRVTFELIWIFNIPYFYCIYKAIKYESVKTRHIIYIAVSVILISLFYFVHEQINPFDTEVAYKVEKVGAGFYLLLSGFIVLLIGLVYIKLCINVNKADGLISKPRSMKKAVLSFVVLLAVVGYLQRKTYPVTYYVSQTNLYLTLEEIDTDKLRIYIKGDKNEKSLDYIDINSDFSERPSISIIRTQNLKDSIYVYDRIYDILSIHENKYHIIKPEFEDLGDSNMGWTDSVALKNPHIKMLLKPFGDGFSIYSNDKYIGDAVEY